MMIQLLPVLWTVTDSHCTASDTVDAPSIVCAPKVSTVIVPAPEFLMIKILPVLPIAVGSVTVKVLAVQLMVLSVSATV